MIARILSSFPGLKSRVKKAYIAINYYTHKKNYPYSLHINASEIGFIEPTANGTDTFFGYYDKSPDNGKGKLIYCQSNAPTDCSPNADKPISIYMLNRATGKKTLVAETDSYNWQQGARAQWIDDSHIIFNTTHGNKYIARVCDVNSGKIIRKYDFPVQDCYKAEFYYSLDYRRLERLQPDYGYNRLPSLSNVELANLQSDGIRKVSLADGSHRMVITLEQVVQVAPRHEFDRALHTLNHLMISPDGKNIIFIHRWFVNSKRFDRLFLFDGKNLKLIADENMVSHLCWIDNRTIFGYLRHNDLDGFYFINIESNKFTPCPALTNLGNGDGHPTSFGNLIAVDTYPDKSRMQHIYLYNRVTKKLTHVAEFFSGLKYQNICRCDLHPRFSSDGSKIFFDTVACGARRLAFVDVSHITN